ncbi:hypothetical protein BDW59DRAFT_140439 [Aspergillus cavernicola]|uniref:Uncharacterized protein n=1 Tax=Aspergillus cavernicola TaxID=176166 RepID=A0ABR4ITN9_9EURO
MFTRSSRLCLFLAPPVVATYAIHRGLSTLESRYPTLPADDSTSSLALRTPSSPSTQHSPHIDIYSARIPVRALLAHMKEPEVIKNSSSNTSLNTIWARAVFGSRICRLEGSIIGFFTQGSFNPGDIGNTPEDFNPIPSSGDGKEKNRELLHGALTVERPPSQNNPCGLLISWKMPDEPRLFFEKISRWGYPWRLMSGGRHEFGVSGPFSVPEREEEGMFVKVRFASAHDYEVFPEEGDLGRQKTIPAWTARLHRGYAMFILDGAVRELVGSR